MLKTAFVFPGQGSQSVTMGKDLYDNFKTAKEVFEEACDSIGIDIKKLCFEGPGSDLALTHNTQPALLTVSTAAYRVLTEESGINAVMMAGHSLGEYSALVASGALSFADGIKLVRFRGEVMNDATSKSSGKMAAILGLSREDLLSVLEEAKGNEVLAAANFNCPGQIVISGNEGAIDRAMELCKQKGAKRALELAVSGPFHTELMEDAAVKLKEKLADTKIAEAKCAVYSNVTGKPYGSAGEIPALLVGQIKSSVMWEDSVNDMVANGAAYFVEVGPKKVLSGLIKRITKEVVSSNMCDTDTLKSTITTHNKIQRG